MKKNEEVNREHRAFFVAVIGLAIAIWPIAFNLGAYKTVLYPHLFSILVVSIVILLGDYLVTGVIWKTNRSRIRGRGIMVMPSLWLVAELTAYYVSANWLDFFLLALSVLTGLVSMPYIAYVIATNIVPGLEKITDRRLLSKLVFIIAVAGGLGFLAGLFHNQILSCDDFTIAGAFVPDNCWDGGE